LTRFIDLLHWEDRTRSCTEALTRILYEWVYANPKQSFDIIQRCHAVFWNILAFDNWGVDTKKYVLGICYMMTTDADDGVFFVIDQGYLSAIARYLERTETVRHDNTLIELAIKTFYNLLLCCLTKGYATREMITRICSVKNLMESLCTLVLEPIQLRQEWAMRTLGHLFLMTKHFGMSQRLAEEAEEYGLWEQVNKIYNESPEEEMTRLAESLLAVQDKNMGMDCYDEGDHEWGAAGGAY
jgi:hypothetical protein